MTLSENDVISLIAIIEDLRQRIEDLEALVNEQREFVVSSSFPVEPFNDQIVLRIDQPGAVGGGTLYRYSSGTGTWIQLT